MLEPLLARRRCSRRRIMDYKHLARSRNRGGFSYTFIKAGNPHLHNDLAAAFRQGLDIVRNPRDMP